MVGSAYLRVFQPLDTLQPSERRRWERYIETGEHRVPLRPVYRQRPTGARGRLGLLTTEEDRADVRLVEGRWFVCPWRTRIRVLAALLALRETVAPEVADALVPEGEARRVARELARLRRRDPSAVPAILQSAWHVPVRWFVLFDEGERLLQQAADGAWRIRYWTSIREARLRARRAIAALEGADMAPVGVVIREMDEWLSAFHPASAVELDYGEVADGLGWNELDEDHSAREIQASVEALEAGDPDGALERYQAVAGHWAEVRIRESLN